MPNTRLISLNAGAGQFTIIRATITTHTLTVFQNGTRSTQLQYKVREDGFTNTYTTQVGDIITETGHGKSGLLGRPAGYNGPNPVTGLQEPPLVAASAGDSGGGDKILMVKSADDSVINVVVVESESEA